MDNKTAENNQFSQGELIKLCENENQNPSGDLIASEEGSQFKTIKESIEELAIDEIKNCEAIPDYREPTDLRYPCVVKSPSLCICTEGWDLIIKAKAANETVITCHIEHVMAITDEEAAIRKAASRIRPRGGAASYSEIIQKVRCLHNILVSSRNVNVFYYGHGGDRKSENFGKNRGDDIIEILIDRLGKSRNKIREYLNHSEYLNDDTMSELVNLKVTKDFFEKAQANKRFRHTQLKSQGLSLNELTLKISAAMIQMQKEYATTDKIKSIIESVQEELPPQTPTLEQKQSTRPPVFKPWMGNDEETTISVPEITRDGILQDLAGIGTRLLSYNNDMTLDQLSEHCNREILNLVNTCNKIRALKTHTETHLTGKEAANG